MSGGFPIGLELCNAQALGVVLTTSIGTSVPASGTANTLGLFVTISAATPCDCCYIGINVANGGATGSEAVNIAVGSSGNEKIIIANLMVDSASGEPNTALYIFPVSIPAGTRISAQSQCNGTSSNCKVIVYLFDGGFQQMEGYGGVDSIGFVSASTEGTTLTANATANTKATSYTTLVTSTQRDYSAFSVYFDSLQTTATNGQFLCDIALGAASSEQIILPNLFMQMSSVSGNGPCITGFAGMWPLSIPANTRVSARIQCSTGSGKIGMTMYGLYE